MVGTLLSSLSINIDALPSVLGKVFSAVATWPAGSTTLSSSAHAGVHSEAVIAAANTNEKTFLPNSVRLINSNSFAIVSKSSYDIIFG